MSVSMAIVDYVPVLFFIVSAVIIQRGLYDKMSKGAFALLSGGTVMVIAAGLMKATWKLLYALGICDFERLNQAFFPMQSVGFLLAGISVCALLFFRQKKAETLAAAGAPAVFSGTMIFVALMVLGCLGYCGGLALYTKRQGKKKAPVLFLAAFVFMLAMGYLSSRDFAKPAMNWIAEGVNVVGQLVLLVAAVMMVRPEKAQAERGEERS